MHMNKLIVFLSRIKWIGMIGLLGNILDNQYLKLFWLIMLFGFIEIFYNLPVFFQSIKQLFSIPIVYISHGFKLPTKNNYICKSRYILPFEGRWSVVNGGVDKEVSHSWSILPQRYAYDFLIIDNSGKTYKDDPKLAENYYCYGMNIIAPADGEIVVVSGKYNDSKVYGDGTVDCNAKDIRGNFVVIKHNDYEYSTIAHIMPKSILVTLGQKVKQGEIIAKCGNSGNSSEPHIHFQLQNGKSFFASAGLPIEFSDITITNNACYNLYDNRPLPSKYKDTLFEEGNNRYSFNYIHRTQMVGNNCYE